MVMPQPRRRRRPRRPRPRICLRKGCGHQLPATTLEPTLLPGPRMPPPTAAAGRPPGGRPDDARTRRPKPSTPKPNVRAVSALASLPQTPTKPEVTPARGHAAKIFLPFPLCDRPGCYEPPLKSVRNPAHYCGPACRQAVHRVRDRERKWRSRSRFRTRRARAREYAAARARRSGQPDNPARTT